MNAGLIAGVLSTGAVALAEMGDKSQLLAMAFAARYKTGKVLVGIFIATILNHALAVVVGSFITRIAALEIWVQAIAAVSFILFGLWTIRGDKLEGEEKRTTRFGAIITVALVFFAAEMGDKTQLATIALAARFPEYPVVVLAGTTAGMLIADIVGIVVGVIMCKRIPEKVVKMISACAFIVFGFAACYQVLVHKIGLNIYTAVIIIALIGAVTVCAAYNIVKRSKHEGGGASFSKNCRRKRK